MMAEFYKVCSIRLSGKVEPKGFSMGQLVYVYRITDETNQPQLISYIDDSILGSVHEICPEALLCREDFYNKEQLKQSWESRLANGSDELWVLPTAEFGDVQDAGWRQMNGEKIPEMPAFAVSLYMDVVGCLEDRFFPFNTIALRYPMTLKREEADSVKLLSWFVRKAVRRLEDILIDDVQENG